VEYERLNGIWELEKWAKVKGEIWDYWELINKESWDGIGKRKCDKSFSRKIIRKSSCCNRNETYFEEKWSN